MLMMLALRWHSVAAWVEPTPAEAHDAGLQWHLMATFVEPTPADAHDAGTAVAFNGCLGGDYPS